MKFITAIITVTGILIAQTVALPQFENVDCESCNEAFFYCKDNGVTEVTKKGEVQTCRDHVCCIRPECRQCPGEFTLCQNRFPRYCGNKPCH
ncbi:hypothetical protein FB567DRAFT_78307 [Paraphoma chrysanthemicola]|uniref:Uncharacterized protein n=1 Tax=Paraphoma chrysanthemicola TaxID=798071 RepID=A0A8K0R3S7_9PLEO|nr:hypothetical protein FB567DRAFT_78307 [Paraphoma chrysanthemicola]